MFEEMAPWGIALFIFGVACIVITLIRIILTFIKDAKEKKELKNKK